MPLVSPAILVKCVVSNCADEGVMGTDLYVIGNGLVIENKSLHPLRVKELVESVVYMSGCFEAQSS